MKRHTKLDEELIVKAFELEIEIGAYLETGVMPTPITEEEWEIENHDWS